MALRINGLGQGPLADRRLLGERQQRGQDQHESPPRHQADHVERRHRASEQLRAEFAALNGAVQQAEDALAIATGAEQGLVRVTEQLAALEARLRAVARGAAPLPEQKPQAWVAEVLAVLEEVAETTRFGPRRLLDGSLGCSGVAVGDGLEFVGAGPHTRSSPPHGYEVLLSEEPVRATVLGERALTADRIAEGVRLSLREGGRAARLVTQRGQTPRDVAAALQAAAREAGLALAVEATGDGRLLVQHRLFGSAHRFAVGSSLPGVLSTPQGAPRVVSNGRDIAGTMNGEPAWGDGQTLTGCFGNPTTDGLVVRYTGLPFTGATGRLRHSRPSVLKPRVFAGRVVVAQQALVFRLGGAPAEQINLRLDSVRPRHLARGVANASGFTALADVRVTGSVALRDALLMVAQARAEVETGLEALRKLAHGTLTEALGRLRVQSQNVAASVPDLHAPDAALHAVQALSLAIVREARTALSAQAHPPQGSLLELLDDDETTHPGPRWN